MLDTDKAIKLIADALAAMRREQRDEFIRRLDVVVAKYRPRPSQTDELASALGVQSDGTLDTRRRKVLPRDERERQREFIRNAISANGGSQRVSVLVSALVASCDFGNVISPTGVATKRIGRMVKSGELTLVNRPVSDKPDQIVAEDVVAFANVTDAKTATATTRSTGPTRIYATPWRRAISTSELAD